MTVTKPFCRLLDLRCDADAAYYPANLNLLRNTSIGYLLKLKVNNQEIQTDICVENPTNADKKINAIGLFEYISWDGQPTDPIGITLKLSSKTRASLLEAFYSSVERPTLEIEWSIYSFDHNEKKMFKSFHTGNQPIVLTFTDGSYCVVDERLNEKYLNFTLSASLSPFANHEGQNLFVAFRPNGKIFEFPIKNADIKN